jgi:hypothetical protein
MRISNRLLAKIDQIVNKGDAVKIAAAKMAVHNNQIVEPVLLNLRIKQVPVASSTCRILKSKLFCTIRP